MKTELSPLWVAAWKELDSMIGFLESIDMSPHAFVVKDIQDQFHVDMVAQRCRRMKAPARRERPHKRRNIKRWRISRLRRLQYSYLRNTATLIQIARMLQLERTLQPEACNPTSTPKPKS